MSLEKIHDLRYRGLDVHPKTIQRFSSQRDFESVALMNIIYEDEITHVGCGLKWFTYICHNSDPPKVCFCFMSFIGPPVNGRSYEMSVCRKMEGPMKSLLSVCPFVWAIT